MNRENTPSETTATAVARGKTKTVTLDRVGSHWLEAARGHQPGEPFSKEELYPDLTVAGVPRVGDVHAHFSVDRYVASSYNERTDTSSPVWIDWRIILREVKPEHGVGPTARTIIREACEPVIRDWLASEDYAEGRRRAAAHTAARLIRDQGSRYGYDSARRDLEAMRPAMGDDRANQLAVALNHFDTAAKLLDAATAEQVAS